MIRIVSFCIYQECESKPVMTSVKFDTLVIKHKAELRNKYEKMVEQQKKDQEASQIKPQPTADGEALPYNSENNERTAEKVEV